MNIFYLIHETITKKLSDFKDLYEFISNYQVALDKVIGLLTAKSHYTQKNTEIYFKATILMNIGLKYSRLVFAIQKDQKDETTNLAKAIL